MIKKKVVITGASGFIGRHLIEVIDHNLFEVYTVDLTQNTQPEARAYSSDLRDFEKINRILDEIQPNFIVHLASLISPNREFKEFNSQIQNTLIPSLNIAQACPESVELAIFFGSSDEYGNNEVPFKEEQNPQALSPYGWAKISSYYGVRYICEQKKKNWCWIRPSLVFGPNQKGNSFIASIMKACITGENVDFTKGEQTRDFVYVKDLARYIYAILKFPVPALNQIINISSGQERSLVYIAKEIQNISKSKCKLNFGILPYRLNEKMRFFCSSEKIKKLYPDLNQTDLSQALQETLNEHTI